MNLLSLSDLRVSLGGKPVLKGISFTVAAGEFVGLIGPNGTGKSTLLRTVLGSTPFTGHVALRGRAISRMAARERADHVAYLPQEREIAWPVSVEMVVSLGRRSRRRPFFPLAAADHAAIETAMRRMEVDGLRRRPAVELSGGEKARVLIARALAQEAPLLLADEPAAGLDPAQQIALMQTFSAAAEEGRAVVASMHDLGLAARWCTRLVLLDRGMIAADGPPQEVLTPAQLRAVYGVEVYLGEARGAMIVQPLELATELSRRSSMGEAP